MEIFNFRNQLINDYKDYIESFIQIRDQRIKNYVDEQFKEGALWPEPLIQLNPSFEPGNWIDELVGQNFIHPECSQIFRIKKHGQDKGKPLRLHKHQSEAVKIATQGKSFVLTTGTGSGKSLAYIIPIVSSVLQQGSGQGIKAIIIYPMNALANSQYQELTKFLCFGFPEGKNPVRFEKYTGQESDEARKRILADPPDILLTNYVMMELILTRPDEAGLVQAAQDLRFLVLDELHTYRGRQGADVALLVRRVRETLNASHLQCIGTSATLAGEGTFHEQSVEVAEVASQLFGTKIEPDQVIGESLKRITNNIDLEDEKFLKLLKEQVASAEISFPGDFKNFINQPISIWIESTFGLKEEANSGRLIRAKPRSITGEEGAAVELSKLTGQPIEQCAQMIKKVLLAGYKCQPNPETGFPPFAFRLHQYISRGDTVYASLEVESDRHITIYGQQFVPGDRNKILLPLAFCRECGQEYYCVYKKNSQSGEISFGQRELTDQQGDDESEPGFLYYSSQNPWPIDENEIFNRLPDDWLESKNGRLIVRRDRKQFLPQAMNIGANGKLDNNGLTFQYVQAPFRFCLSCGVSYGIRQRTDFSKLSTLSSEGRSTATTIMSLSAIKNLKKASSLKPEARKMLSFTDNRQDASLQAGHFNDFIEIGILRAALYQAVVKAGADGLTHENLSQQVFDALNLPLELYLINPQIRFQGLKDAQKALRNVLGYRLYRDLKRGWRITSPNLENCGLLIIEYQSLVEICRADDLWQHCHPALATASPEVRVEILKVLLDFMRRELAIKVDYLDSAFQEKIQQQSSQYLVSPWALDEDEALIHAAVLYPRSRQDHDYRGNVFLSSRSGFGIYLRRNTTFPEFHQNLKLEDTEQIIRQLLDNLHIGGIVDMVDQGKSSDHVPGYQLRAAAMLWKAGDGTTAFHDPIRVPNLSAVGSRTNPFFLNYYRAPAQETFQFEAREHTAQVPYEDRIKREEKFRNGELPILYCSPTMELGVDIAELNVVNMRNVPPTPANYAQRSGRAGRSGQPAFVFTYCTTGSPHDQWYFKRPEQMVAGNVTPPRMDLANEDLIRAHIHAIWLAETGLDLGNSLKEILDVNGDDPGLGLLDHIKEAIASADAKIRAKNKAEQVLNSIKAEVINSDWYHENWLDSVLNHVDIAFDNACERWRNLYRSALAQAKAQDQIIRDASRSYEDKRRAERLRSEAESQLKLLTEIKSVSQSDFYSYRYFASEGFLPGYNFPRLPISAYIPGRRTKQRDEFLSRPRFLAISEFGPQAFVYHEGSRYIINKVILPVHEESLGTGLAKLCSQCGYLHPITGGAGADLCELCGNPLDPPLQNLFRLQNVSTKRRDKITSDEEERMRLGYELITGVRFIEHAGRKAFQTAWVVHQGINIVKLTYGNAATIWRINLGWKRRKKKSQYGFVLDRERGLWERNEQLEDSDSNDSEPFSARLERVVPYVEDRRNCLLIEPQRTLDLPMMASLQSALKNAIQLKYQLEDFELAVEPLPDQDNRRLILIYEASEGGAGVLKRLVQDAEALPAIARIALQICHFDPESGDDLHRATRARENCEAACYDCLMSYSNQPDHEFLDRHIILDFLLRLSQATINVSPAEASRETHLESLLRLCQTDLERTWLKFMDHHQLRLPSTAQSLIEKCNTRPDFLYEDQHVAIYIDGPVHDYPERQQRDLQQAECMEDHGYNVIRFGHQQDWLKIVNRYPFVFGKRD